MPFRLDTAAADFEERFSALLQSKREDGADVSAAVAAIIDQVRAEGDAAVIALTNKFDRRNASSMAELALDQETIAAAYARIDDDLRDALETAAARIRAFHEKQLPQAIDYQDDAGVELGMRHGPVDAAGLYVPGGKAAYPSSVLMNAMPATVAGVGRRVMVVPAPDGELSDPVLAAAHIAGISECWTIGGRRRWQHWHGEPKASALLTRSSAPAMPMLPQQSVRFLAVWGSIPLPGLRNSHPCR